MDSIFVLTKTNFDFFKSIEQDRPEKYWIVYGRVCYHQGDSDYVIHNHVIHKDKHLYDGYLHVESFPKKAMYAMSHYTLSQLKDMASRLMLPSGTKLEMYTSIHVIMDEIFVQIKKN